MKKAVMYGAGNIGRGFIGQLFSESGYEVVFIDINPVVLDRLNMDKSYPIKIVGDDHSREVTVRNVRGVNAADPEAVAAEIATADIMATAVGVNVLSRITKTIAAGLRRRWQQDCFTPLNIIICENLLNANHYLEKLLKQELAEKEREFFDRTIGLVEASIGRMVPVMTPQMQGGNPLRVCVEEYCVLPVDKAAFKGEIPAIKHMVPFTPFDFYIQRKLFMHNASHATAAYLGWLKSCKYIWQAILEPEIRLFVFKALEEAALAMHLAHGVPIKELLDHADNLVNRFGNKALGDTVARVGKDPIRKLSYNDRLVGAAKLCENQGVKPVYLALGIAAGLMFNPAEDEAATKLQDHIKANGLTDSLKTFSGIEKGTPLFETILSIYRIMSEQNSLNNLMCYCSRLKES